MSRRCVFLTLLLSTLRGCRSEMEAHIVGGNFARIEDYPHSAFLAIHCVTKTGVDNYSCGSSILNQAILLTAAHCFEDCQPASNIAVGVAVTKKRSNLSHMVSYFTIHPMFHSKKVINDIALARLSANLHFGTKVKRVILLRNPPYNEIAEVAGWGIVDEGKRLGTMYLKSAEQKIWKRKDCVAVLKRLNKGTICARGLPDTSNYGYPAAGDSGSALVIRRFIQVGIVSIKYPQRSRSIIVYTHIPYFYKWIMKTARKLYCIQD